ncbi:uncharacterized protein A1O9_02297 [Exophiala aquamarina CBS 119918]|uniref:Uncharacterized protein n=1 Tax=Exophiala aquamarina CBS 119918 TaxID=1182545 RepID=A0A072PLK2_9EURO|nr:uncharacterized protein A1O9_02297 [Exophiala aquamarina CBS 119918]KEF60736.1 hypothetical protein A1O9_02297 [Exophiala aquamarina CBS 119918]
MIECQIDIAVDTIKRVEHINARSLETTEDDEQEWGNTFDVMAGSTLLPLAGDRWTGANVRGKKPQNSNFVGDSVG